MDTRIAALLRLARHELAAATDGWRTLPGGAPDAVARAVLLEASMTLLPRILDVSRGEGATLRLVVADGRIAEIGGSAANNVEEVLSALRGFAAGGGGRIRSGGLPPGKRRPEGGIAATEVLALLPTATSGATAGPEQGGSFADALAPTLGAACRGKGKARGGRVVDAAPAERADALGRLAVKAATALAEGMPHVAHVFGDGALVILSGVAQATAVWQDEDRTHVAQVDPAAVADVAALWRRTA